jgi:transcriptional regulator with XRE-family HTH domain
VTGAAKPEIGTLLRDWRTRRRLTQMELALDAGISTRHLSFVETGRSRPGRELLLRLLDQLDLPFREQNHLLLAAGHAPAFPTRDLDAPELEPVRAALELILTGHEPNPAVVFDRAWNMVAANAAMRTLAEGVEVDPGLLGPPVNVLRLGLHPKGFASIYVNPGQWHAHFRERLERQLAVSGDPEVAALLEEISGYPVPGGEDQQTDDDREFLGPLKVRAPDGLELSFFGMFATFDTPFEVTTSELAMELLFPADAATADYVKAAEVSSARPPGGGGARGPAGGPLPAR